MCLNNWLQHFPILHLSMAPHCLQVNRLLSVRSDACFSPSSKRPRNGDDPHPPQPLEKTPSPEPLALSTVPWLQAAFHFFVSKLNIHNSIVQNFLAFGHLTVPSLRCLPAGVCVLTVASRLWILQCSRCLPVSGITCVLPCPLTASPWTCFLSPHVWQPASWVTSSRDHLDVFRLGAGPEITLQGLRCHHHLQGSCKPSGPTGAERHSRVCAH